MNWASLLNVFVWLLERVMKDTDGDGRPDLFDSKPDDPQEK